MAPASLVELTPLSSYARNFDVNTLGALRLIQACLPLLRRSSRSGTGGARIVNVTSFLGRVAPFSLSVYCASKFALEALSSSLRAELRSQGVFVVVVQPGTTRTKLRGQCSEGMQRCWDQASPEQRDYLGPSYMRAMQRSSWLMDLFGRDVDSLLPGVAHAVAARWPRSRYVCGWDSFFGQILPLLPVWLCDFGCLMVLGWPSPARDNKEEREWALI